MLEEERTNKKCWHQLQLQRWGRIGCKYLIIPSGCVLSSLVVRMARANFTQPPKRALHWKAAKQKARPPCPLHPPRPPCPRPPRRPRRPRHPPLQPIHPYSESAVPSWSGIEVSSGKVWNYSASNPTCGITFTQTKFCSRVSSDLVFMKQLSTLWWSTEVQSSSLVILWECSALVIWGKVLSLKV